MKCNELRARDTWGAPVSAFAVHAGSPAIRAFVSRSACWLARGTAYVFAGIDAICEGNATMHGDNSAFYGGQR
eukprot:1488479-Rhodomonas_salina.3